MEIFQDAQTWVTISFCVFVLILWKFGKDKFLQKLDSRIDEIRREIETADSLRVEAQELLAQYQRKQRDAAKESEDIIAAAKTHAAAMQKQAEQEIEAVAVRREQQLQERLRRMEQDTLQEIRAYAAELAVKATSEIIAAQMDKKTNENLVDKSIREIAAQLR